jgi:hypothetical protein
MASSERHRALPSHLQDFLDTTDEADDRPMQSEEELRLRPIPDSPRPVLADPALCEVDAVEGVPPASWFVDEEPEPSYRASGDENDDVEAVDEVLAAQNYLFDAEDDS